MKQPKRGHARDNNLAEKYQTPGQCTTVMIRNIPNQYTQDDLILEVSEGMGSDDILDFFYLPWDSQNNGNIGYTFVNFHNGSLAQMAVRIFSNYIFRLHDSSKVGKVSPAHIQGLENNLRHLQDRAVVHGNLPCSPVVVWKGQKIELGVIFQEIRSQDSANKFNNVASSMPGRARSEDRYSQMPGGGGFRSSGNTIPQALRIRAPASMGGSSAHPTRQAANNVGQSVNASFARLLDRAAGLHCVSGSACGSAGTGANLAVGYPCAASASRFDQILGGSGMRITTGGENNNTSFFTDDASPSELAVPGLVVATRSTPVPTNQAGFRFSPASAPSVPMRSHNSLGNNLANRFGPTRVQPDSSRGSAGVGGLSPVIDRSIGSGLSSEGTNSVPPGLTLQSPIIRGEDSGVIAGVIADLPSAEHAGVPVAVAGGLPMSDLWEKSTDRDFEALAQASRTGNGNYSAEVPAVTMPPQSRFVNVPPRQAPVAMEAVREIAVRDADEDVLMKFLSKFGR